AGVPILFGSDTPVVPLARVAEEFQLLTDAGLSPEESLATATVNAAAALGRADTLGSIAPGKVADLIALHRDPRADLAEMAKVFFVMKGGKVVREDAVR
ncbi:MAG: amidohydrolase family protein, partial [Gammaproteobacteria bacterium]